MDIFELTSLALDQWKLQEEFLGKQLNVLLSPSQSEKRMLIFCSHQERYSPKI